MLGRVRRVGPTRVGQESLLRGLQDQWGHGLAEMQKCHGGELGMNELFCVARHQHNGAIEGHQQPHSSVSGHGKVTLLTLSCPLCLSPTLCFLLAPVYETRFLQATYIPLCIWCPELLPSTRSIHIYLASSMF